MDIEDIRLFCLGLKGTTESFPFDENTLVFKVANKMYCLESLDHKSINIKAEPEKVIELIEEYSSVKPGYHMNKMHWVTIQLDEFIDHELLKQLIINSYNLILSKISRKEREKFESELL